MQGSADYEVKQHSGWLIPLGLLVVIALLCGAFLLFYLRPSAYRSDQMSPTIETSPVAVEIHGRGFTIPANYFAYKTARSGGALKLVELVAVLPSFVGYSNSDAGLFLGDAPDSPLVHMRIREDQNDLSEADRLARIYMPYIVDPAGKPGPYGLVQYNFRDDSGYRQDQLFVGHTGVGAIFFLCVRPASDVPSPGCLAIDRPIAPGVALSYRFKLPYLAHWHEVADGVAGLVARFQKSP